MLNFDNCYDVKKSKDDYLTKIYGNLNNLINLNCSNNVSVTYKKLLELNDIPLSFSKYIESTLEFKNKIYYVTIIFNIIVIICLIILLI